MNKHTEIQLWDVPRLFGFILMKVVLFWLPAQAPPPTTGPKRSMQ